jgi:hypothetical protein
VNGAFNYRVFACIRHEESLTIRKIKQIEEIAPEERSIFIARGKYRKCVIPVVFFVCSHFNVRLSECTEKQLRDFTVENEKSWANMSEVILECFF